MMFEPEIADIDFSFFMKFPIEDIEGLVQKITTRVWMEKNIHIDLYYKLEQILKKECEKKNVVLKETSIYGSICATILVDNINQFNDAREVVKNSTIKFWNLLKRYKETVSML